MAYVVDRVVICDAYAEPDRHYQLLSGGRSKLVEGRRPSKRFLASAKEAKAGLAGIVGRQSGLFEDLVVSTELENEFVNGLREELRAWRDCGYPGTALVTRRLLEWWFERDEERQAEANRFFFAQREAIEALIYLYEVKNRHKMPETGELLRYALKLATGTGKTVLMALIVTWATLHKRKVSGSNLSNNFLVLVPNLTVRDRVSGVPRGDGLDPAGEDNLYATFDMIPPEYADEFQPNILVRNWQAIPLDARRDDWIDDEPTEDGRFIPASILWALRRRARQDPNTAVRKLLGGWRDLIVINDEAHHVYGEKRGARAEDPEYIKWSKIIDRIRQAARISMVVDLSATPWYGAGSPKPDGTLFEWLVSDFSVYDAFESGLVKVVRLPEEAGQGSAYLGLWDDVKGAKTKEEYLSACKGAIASLYSNWAEDFDHWQSFLPGLRPGPNPVMLVVANDSTRAKWLYEHLTTDYRLLRNPEGDDPRTWHTIQIDSKVFDAEKGNEAVLREMVNTVGKKGRAGEGVRCIVSVNMLSEGWDVKSVTHILGLRAFGSPLLTEQVIGRGLRRVNYDVLNQPLAERKPDSEETVDAFGIPFIGFPVQRRKRAAAGSWGNKPVGIEPDEAKHSCRMRIPNVRSWAVGMSESLSSVVNVEDLPKLVVDGAKTPPDITLLPVVGAKPEELFTLERFRAENPLLSTTFLTAKELLDRTSPNGSSALATGPTFDELLDLVQAYLAARVLTRGSADLRDVGIYYWRQQMLNILDNAVRHAAMPGITTVPILGSPNFLDTQLLRRFQWTGIVATGKKAQANQIPCHTDLEKQFADFLDKATDVLSYLKNERFGFSITYYDSNRPRQYYPDFIVAVRDPDGGQTTWLAETKGEMRPTTTLKQEAAQLWCAKMSGTEFGPWRYLLVPQRRFERSNSAGVKSFIALADSLTRQPMTATL